MKLIQDSAAFIFVAAVAILTAVCMLGVWEVFGNDVIVKSFQTVGLLAGVSVLIIMGAKFIGSGTSAPVHSAPNPVFTGIRQLTLVIMIAASALLALIGVLTIWDVFTDRMMLYQAIGSLAILAFGSFVIVTTCMQRERHPLLHKQSFSGGAIVFGLIMLYLIIVFSDLF